MLYFPFSETSPKWLIDEQADRINKDIVKAPINLFFKISNWWVKNIEAGIMPENFEAYNEEEMQTAASMNAHLLHLLADKVLSN